MSFVNKGLLKDLEPRLGGDSLFDPRGILVLIVPVSFFTSVLTRKISGFESIAFWSIGNLVGFAVTIPLILLLELLRKRFAKDQIFPIWLVPLVGFFLGLAKAVTTNLVGSSLLGENLQTLDARALIGGLAGLVGLPITALMISYLNDSERQRTNLLHAAYQKATLEVTSRKELNQLHGLVSELKSLRSSLEKRLPGASVSEVELALLRELVDRRVRPLSASLYGEIEKRHPTFEFRSLFRLALRSTPPALAISMFYALGTPNFIITFGVPDGVVLGLLAPLFSFIGFKLTFRIIAKLTRGYEVAFLLLASTIPAASAWLGASILGISLENEPFVIPLISIWMLQTVILFTAIRRAIELSKSNQLELQELGDGSLQGDFNDATLAARRRQFANQLHGEVQSRLMTIILRGQAGSVLKNEMVLKELELVQKLVEDSRPRSALSLAEGLTNIAVQWRGIANIKVGLLPLEVDPIEAGKLLQLVDQATTNAIRHGLATEVEIAFEVMGTKTKFCVRDNGIGPAKGRPGLGSTLFNANSSSWELRARPQGGSELILTL